MRKADGDTSWTRLIHQIATASNKKSSTQPRDAGLQVGQPAEKQSAFATVAQSLKTLFKKPDLAQAQFARETMADELARRTGVSKEQAAYAVEKKFPLHKINKSIRDGNFPHFAERALSISAGKLMTRNADRTDAIKKLLPPLVADSFNGQQFDLSHKFSETAKKDILDGFVSLTADLTNPKQMGDDGIHEQTSKDAHRADFTFKSREKTHRFLMTSEPGTAKKRSSDVKEQFSTFSRGNPNVKKVLSTVVGQRAISAQFTALETELGFRASPAKFHFSSPARSKEATEHVSYELCEDDDENVIVTLDYYKGGDVLTDGSSSCPIITGPDPSKPVGPDNYAIKCSVSIKLLRSEMEQGIINPEFISEPGVTVRFTPSLGTPAS